MAANPNIISKANVAPDKEVTQIVEPKPVQLKKRIGDLLVEMFKGYREFLGWTPD